MFTEELKKARKQKGMTQLNSAPRNRPALRPFLRG